MVRDGFGHVLHREGDGRLGPEGNGAGQHLEGDDPDRIDVRPLVQLLPQRLLRRHVLRRPEEHRGERQALVELPPGEAEVEDRDGAGGVDNDVLRLQVAMKDPQPVDRAGSPDDLTQDRHGLHGGNPLPLVDQVPEVLAVDVLHRDERVVAAHAVVVHPRHVRVLDLPVQLDLALEPGQERLLVTLDVRGQDLDGDHLVQLRVERLEDGPDSALAERRQPPVAGGSLEETCPEAVEFLVVLNGGQA
jgi:hypothetical protein